jgi:hypothetical protein
MMRSGFVKGFVKRVVKGVVNVKRCGGAVG